MITPTLFSAHYAFCALARTISRREKAASLKWKFMLSWQSSLLSASVGSQKIAMPAFSMLLLFRKS